MPNALLDIHFCLLLLYLLVVDIVIVIHEFVDSAAWSEFDDAVRHRLYELMVVGSEQDVATELYKIVVESLD